MLEIHDSNANAYVEVYTDTSIKAIDGALL